MKLYKRHNKMKIFKIVSLIVLSATLTLVAVSYSSSSTPIIPINVSNSNSDKIFKISSDSTIPEEVTASAEIQINFSDYDIVVKPFENKLYSTVYEKSRALKKKYSNVINLDEQAKKAQLDLLRVEYTEFMLNEIFPYWYGTEWDFNGHTNTPNSGEIACGYFVSTTLKHSGVNVNRYRFAQQAALNEIKSTQLNGTYRAYLNGSTENFITQIKKELKDGLYVIGLDFHVGYILKRKGEVFFIHSDYVSDKVKIEAANQSIALESSEGYYLGDITHNDALLIKWLYSQELTVVTK